MLDQTTIENIRESGFPQGASQIPDRLRLIQQEFGFQSAEKAEYALVAGCYSPYLEPGDMLAFRKLLDHYGIDYTLLPKEYCCSNPFYFQTVMGKSNEDLPQCDELGKEFLGYNLSQVRSLGAGKILIYCAGCDAIFQRFKETYPEEVLWHPTLLVDLFAGGKLNLEADYFAGCHGVRRAVSGTTPDLESVSTILNRIEGLQLNHLNPNLCCMEQKQLAKLVERVTSRVIITPCSGCSRSLRQALGDNGDQKVVLLSTVIWSAISGEPL